MRPNECLKFKDCKKIELIKTIDAKKYDVDGLIQDICWLCEGVGGREENNMDKPLETQQQFRQRR